MSEPNSSPNEQTPHSENLPSPSSWFAGWAEFSTEPSAEPASAAVEGAGAPDATPAPQPPAEPWEEWQPVNFPNAISADAIERQAMYGQAKPNIQPIQPISRPAPQPNSQPAQPISQPATRRISPERPSWNVATPAGAADAAQAAPQVADMISLIQELNQCNNALLDRVSMLEDALERRQAETGAMPDIERLQITAQALEQQVIQLTEQLEAAQQLGHRQQVLAETLSQELTLSQERITQLEQDCARTQQQYEEQSQRLGRSEALARDLQARLQRQQRYTLQFKAALERCLEVPAALLESPGETDAPPTAQPWQETGATAELLAAPSLLPRASTIQPWSAESAQSVVPSKLVDVLASRSAEGEDSASWLAEVALADADLSADDSSVSSLHLSSNAGSNDADNSDHPAGAGASRSSEADSESPAVAEVSGVTPPNDTAANVIALNFGQSVDAMRMAPEADGAAIAPSSATSPELAATEAAAADNIRSLFREFTELVNEVGSAPSTDGDAETSLWQDLAKLVEGSAEDLLQAGLIDQLAALSTEAIAAGNNLDLAVPPSPPPAAPPHLPSTAATPAAQPSDLKRPSPAFAESEGAESEGAESERTAARSSAFTPAASAPIPPMPPRATPVQPKLLTMPFETHRWATASAADAATPIAGSDAPNPEAAENLAPVVYPTRPTKKLSSLAAIDLPSFPK
ncbi:MAG: hypothetical protein Fur0046_09210 [Cyanobacteria bacterium J069]|nr:MAG: hypothetical protein D6742_18810 [Cyanobacteria bacterium J069]